MTKETAVADRRRYKMIVEFVLSDGKRYRLSDLVYTDGLIHGSYLARKRRGGRGLITGPVPVVLERGDVVRARMFRDVDGSYPFGKPKPRKPKPQPVTA